MVSWAPGAVHSPKIDDVGVLWVLVFHDYIDTKLGLIKKPTVTDHSIIKKNTAAKTNGRRQALGPPRPL